MQIVVTHEMADFDALAAAVAAQKLHPSAQIVLGRRIGREVRTFLALHKDRFPAVRIGDVDQARVSRLILVDVRRRSRLGELAPLLARAERGELEISIYDHHPATDDDLASHQELVEPVGSATTLLVEQMRAQAIEIDPVEATLFSLGIHADTGSLSYAGTTARDALALSWLIGAGADLRLIARYLRPPFSAAQRRALRALLASVELVTLGGLDVGFALVELPRVVDGIAEVTTQAAELVGCAALFAVFGFRSRVQVAARSRSPLIDVGSFLSELGGGGHAAAGSANIKDRSGAEVIALLRTAVAARPPKPTRVADLMSSPVNCVQHDAPLSSLAESLRAWRHTGAPVMRQGRLVGIVSQRDLEQAARAARLALPVSSVMSQPVVSTSADASLEQALALMEREDVGRLPVLRGERLVGIVTRSDLLRVLYRGDDRK
jgi:tRNA nucleotidyltransferase (CCA-adding enzyme)